MRIAVDCMGGDLGPAEMVPGALKAAGECEANIVLVGDEKVIRQHMGAVEGQTAAAHVDIVHAPSTISMDEDPLSAVRHKRDSSVVVAARLVREGSAEAMVSAGSTGALVAIGALSVGRLPGVSRPVLATPVPTISGACVLLDIGANPDCTPEHLLEFATLGSVYASSLLKLDRPRIGLLSNGTEPSKGNAMTVAANKLLTQSSLNFIGNVESRSVLFGVADVVVTDGFTGNILLKSLEGVGSAIFDMVRQAAMENTRSKLGALLMKPALRQVKRRMDYSEYGGAPLLGLAGLLVKAHGSSNRKAFANAIRVTSDLMGSGIGQKMAEACQIQKGSSQTEVSRSD
ncbi:MAG TPA: phosphate acyltransferase PlsX [Bacillota bacterium]|jgi:glycerol-3-phosphate acyltransferase PlsX|nr:phosphate acyltransferase PlsX [Bacillota bacterium]